jgi:hypothetical protein
MKALVTVTDTYGGEANFAWVKRNVINLPDNATDLQIVRLAKKALGWNGLRCNTWNQFDGFTLNPHGLNMVMFVEIMEEGEEV